MAFESDGFWLRVTYVDNGKNTTERRYKMRATTYDDALADATTATTGILAILAGMTGLAIQGYGIESRAVETSLVLPGTGYQKERVAQFTLQIHDSPFDSGTVDVPGPKQGNTTGIFQADAGPLADEVDFSKAGVTAFIGLFNDATGKLYFSDNETADGYIDGRAVHRRSSKRRSRRVG